MIKDKIKPPQELKRIVRRLKMQRKRVAFTNGCFDILHRGHVRYLEKAKLAADILIVGLNSDQSVRRIKGRNRPINSLRERMEIVASLESTDFITYFNENTPKRLIKELRPNLLIKGGDWKKKDIVGRDIIESYGGKAKTIAYIKGYSTSAAIERVCKGVHAK
ncbi:MAG: D-glycero-beta-D-manno-heptose 1-phosphate adenylyltransferase [Candidatus Omnitrophica bacterium]|nr:D-glycero-beta-D-manno-heptose 1-phosphate adenylyltransferase [Candidatus Omnitrophota bacterium]